MNTIKTTFYPPIKMTTSINSFSVNVIELQLNRYVKVGAVLYSIDGVAISNRIYTLENEDYTKWGTDDKYVINWVKTKLQEEADPSLKPLKQESNN